MRIQHTFLLLVWLLLVGCSDNLAISSFEIHEPSSMDCLVAKFDFKLSGLLISLPSNYRDYYYSYYYSLPSTDLSKLSEGHQKWIDQNKDRFREIQNDFLSLSHKNQYIHSHYFLASMDSISITANIDIGDRVAGSDISDLFRAQIDMNQYHYPDCSRLILSSSDSVYTLRDYCSPGVLCEGHFGGLLNASLTEKQLQEVVFNVELALSFEEDGCIKTVTYSDSTDKCPESLYTILFK